MPTEWTLSLTFALSILTTLNSFSILGQQTYGPRARYYRIKISYMPVLAWPETLLIAALDLLIYLLANKEQDEENNIIKGIVYSYFYFQN